MTSSVMLTCPRDGTILPEDRVAEGDLECPHCRQVHQPEEVVPDV